MRVTPRSAALAAAAFAAVVLASACSSTATPTATLSTAPGTSATSAPATSAPATSAPPATTPPATPAAPLLTTAEAAAKHLYNAWKAGDKPAALQGASKSAVDALFSEDWKDKTYFFGGCSGDTQCQYNWSGGVINMTISGNASSGFKVTAVDRGSAG